MANLVIEIGNTAVKAAWIEGVTLGRIFRYQGEKVIEYILSLMEKEKPEVITIASSFAVPENDRKAIREKCRCLIVMDGTDNEILQRNGLPEYLSYDRAASIIAARHMFKGKSCTIFDFGTTLSVDFMDASGLYKGGIISPGCRTRFKSLNRYAKSLPLVDTPEFIPSEGNSIESSIEAGVISGIMFETEGYIGRYPGNIVIFTGGDAIYFAKRMKNSIFVVSNLVLMGLALITDNYVAKIN